MPDETMSNNNATVLADLYKWKQRARDLKAQLDVATKERDDWKAKHDAKDAEIAARDQRIAEFERQPSDLRVENERLKQEAKLREIKDTFYAKADAAKVRPEARDDVWELLKIDPAKDAGIDGESIAERLADALKARPYLLQSEPETGGGAAGAAKGQAEASKPALAARPAGPGLSRGAPEAAAKPADSVADVVRSTFEASRGAGANPYRIA